MTIFQVLQTLNIPCAYAGFKGDTSVEPPYIVYLGNGQDTFKADNTIYHKQNAYRIEYYFSEKNEAKEDEIETALLNHGYIYEKSDDVYIETEGVYVIYYFI